MINNCTVSTNIIGRIELLIHPYLSVKLCSILNSIIKNYKKLNSICINVIIGEFLNNNLMIKMYNSSNNLNYYNKRKNIIKNEYYDESDLCFQYNIEAINIDNDNKYIKENSFVLLNYQGFIDDNINNINNNNNNNYNDNNALNKSNIKNYDFSMSIYSFYKLLSPFKNKYSNLIIEAFSNYSYDLKMNLYYSNDLIRNELGLSNNSNIIKCFQSKKIFKKKNHDIKHDLEQLIIGKERCITLDYETNLDTDTSDNFISLGSDMFSLKFDFIKFYETNINNSDLNINISIDSNNNSFIEYEDSIFENYDKNKNSFVYIEFKSEIVKFVLDKFKINSLRFQLNLKFMSILLSKQIFEFYKVAFKNNNNNFIRFFINNDMIEESHNSIDLIFGICCDKKSIIRGVVIEDTSDDIDLFYPEVFYKFACQNIIGNYLNNDFYKRYNNYNNFKDLFLPTPIKQNQNIDITNNNGIDNNNNNNFENSFVSKLNINKNYDYKNSCIKTNNNNYDNTELDEKFINIYCSNKKNYYSKKLVNDSNILGSSSSKNNLNNTNKKLTVNKSISLNSSLDIDVKDLEFEDNLFD